MIICEEIYANQFNCGDNLHNHKTQVFYTSTNN